MIKLHRNIFIIVIAYLVAACGNQDMGEKAIPEENQNLTLTVIYTNDEHGWMDGGEGMSGAAEISGLWKTVFQDSEAILILSGGDNWTGPAISTWFEGEGMVETMNAMGYTASAVGNHEFDFGFDTLRQRTEQADYQYLGANIRHKSDGLVPVELGIYPYKLVDIAGLKIGLIGLANIDTPSLTKPDNVANLIFLDYAETLREYVPLVWEEGADLIFVPSHLCTWELAPLSRDVQDLEITLFGGGHCHEEYAEVIAGSIVLSGGSNYKSFAYATFDVNMDEVSISNVDYGVAKNEDGLSNPQIDEIVAYWSEKTGDELDEVIGYTDVEIPQRSEGMAELITESWLLAYPADVALTNWGGMRDKIPQGDITISNIISVMPFNNVLIEVELTGVQLLRVLAFGDQIPPVGGIHLGSGQWFFDKTGEPIIPDNVYSLLVTDYLYAGGSDYTMLGGYDPDAYDTAISWRQPVLDWILAQDSNAKDPLDLNFK